MNFEIEVPTAQQHLEQLNKENFERYSLEVECLLTEIAQFINESVSVLITIDVSDRSDPVIEQAKLELEKRGWIVSVERIEHLSYYLILFAKD